MVLTVEGVCNWIGTLISINNAQSLVNNRDSTSIKDLTNGADFKSAISPA